MRVHSSIHLFDFAKYIFLFAWQKSMQIIKGRFDAKSMI